MLSMKIRVHDKGQKRNCKDYIPIVIRNLSFRRGSDLNLSQTQSTLKQFNSNELDDAIGIKFSGKLTKHGIKF